MREVIYKNTAINYTLIYKKVKNINLRVKSDGSITVSANRRVSVKRIDEFILSKGSFILDALRKFQERKSCSTALKEYVTGEEYALLGKKLLLKVEEAKIDEISNDESHIYLKTVEPTNFARKQKLLLEWRRKFCRRLYTVISTEVHKKFPTVPFPEIKIRKMKSRWGSCRPQKAIITLNENLIETPIECIEYVILHEFCHFIHPNHSKVFYDLMDKHMPDRKFRKKLLEKSTVGTFEPMKP